MSDSKSIDQRYTVHLAMLSTKAEIEALRADVFKALTDQTWKLGAIILSGLGLLLAVLKFH